VPDARGEGGVGESGRGEAAGRGGGDGLLGSQEECGGVQAEKEAGAGEVLRVLDGVVGDADAAAGGDFAE
jgi:hypothetical protein